MGSHLQEPNGGLEEGGLGDKYRGPVSVLFDGANGIRLSADTIAVSPRGALSPEPCAAPITVKHTRGASELKLVTRYVHRPIRAIYFLVWTRTLRGTYWSGR